MAGAWLAAAAALGVDSRPAGADEPAAQADVAERRREHGARGSIWDGVYTEAQARRGEYVYPGPCGRCHGVRLNGAPDDPDMLPAPPIAGPKFLREWDGRSLAALLEYVRTTMPENNPRSLSDGEYADLVAYMLFVSGAPAGTAELRPESGALSGIEIRNAP